MYYKDREFFNKESLLSSYWSGFIAADGSLNKNYSKFTLRLAIKDKEHLLKFVRDVKFNGKTKENSKMISVEICSVDEWYESLHQLYNITPVKTYKLKEPNITNFENKLAYCVGLLDGDGCVGSSGGYTYIRWHGTFDIVNWIKNQIDFIVPNTNKVRKHSDNLWVFQITGKKAETFIEKLPDGLLEICMERKLRGRN